MIKNSLDETRFNDLLRLTGVPTGLSKQLYKVPLTMKWALSSLEVQDLNVQQSSRLCTELSDRDQNA